MSDTQMPWAGLGWGHLAIGTGALALALAMLTVFGGPFAPQPSAATTIGEIAGEMRAAARRAVNGEPQPAPVPRGWDIDRVLMLAAPLLGVVAVVLAIVSALRREGLRFAGYGAALGMGAIVFQFVWWIALLIAGTLLLVAIIENIGDIIGS
jgi:hypothetical protein